MEKIKKETRKEDSPRFLPSVDQVFRNIQEMN